MSNNEYPGERWVPKLEFYARVRRIFFIDPHFCKMKRNNGSVFENRNFFKKIKNLKIFIFLFHICMWYVWSMVSLPEKSNQFCRSKICFRLICHGINMMNFRQFINPFFRSKMFILKLEKIVLQVLCA